jgi:hypothetical protein
LIIIENIGKSVAVATFHMMSEFFTEAATKLKVFADYHFFGSIVSTPN